jgi:hypothetical protein
MLVKVGVSSKATDALPNWNFLKNVLEQGQSELLSGIFYRTLRQSVVVRLHSTDNKGLERVTRRA